MHFARRWCHAARWPVVLLLRGHCQPRRRHLLQVVDEDDERRTAVRLPRHRIVRLEDGVGSLAKGDAVLAVFPDTTSFYRVICRRLPARTGSCQVL